MPLNFNNEPDQTTACHGEFITLKGERFYAINNVDHLAPFFISVISDSDHWLFVSSTGGLTAGRVSPETALFPYIAVDKIHDSAAHTGSKSLLRVHSSSGDQVWEPFNREHDHRFNVTRNLYKNVLGDKICFEEINHNLELVFRYTWVSSDEFGFVRQCELQNIGEQFLSLELLDGLQNILPAGTPLQTQTTASNLVDAYKWNELDEQTGLACYTLYSGISDRAEPCESLKANTVFCLGLDSPTVLLSALQLDRCRRGEPLKTELNQRGIRGAYLVNTRLELPAGSRQCWQLVANTEQTQQQVVALRRQLDDPQELAAALSGSINKGSDALARIMAAADASQLSNEEIVSVHHYANVAFNTLRGGIFYDQYQVSRSDFSATVNLFNHKLYQRHASLLREMPEQLDFAGLQSRIKDQDDPQLERLGLEYLPITFGRRHGDPSRPWNQFEIKLKDGNGNRLLSYQGNWRDIFQNWEALSFSYPEFIESVIAKFVNASTLDGYNPYRIGKAGIDWEVEDADDPWSYIGYWGDHQIIYLLKLLELSQQFHPGKLVNLLDHEIFCYANVPYRIKPLEALLGDAKSTVEYDWHLAAHIEEQVEEIGADGRLVLSPDGDVYQVNLLEKLLVPLLSKLGNLVLDGGIWLNTQRPEWNDANNALVGQGLSMVTACYLRRYICFLQKLLLEKTGSTTLSLQVSEWLNETAKSLADTRQLLNGKPVSEAQRYRSLLDLGGAASRYRLAVYARESFPDKVAQHVGPVKTLLDDALAVIDHTIAVNQRADGLYHAYNLLSVAPGTAEISSLYPMLEGQVAALSSGAIEPPQAVALLDALFASDIYRSDLKTFMLYPDRQLPGFLDKNRVPASQVEAIGLLRIMLEQGDESIVLRDAEGIYRFNAELINISHLNTRLEMLAPKYGEELRAAIQPLRGLYEQVFNHQAFTGRSGGMFGFEGLGCVYWHMVAKLLLAVQEIFFAAYEQGADQTSCKRLGEAYYRVRKGLGFNKTPAEFGAFPADPYSHTPKHAGAQQPGMTGQVKEEILARFGELGIRVGKGTVDFTPGLLRACEFSSTAKTFRYLDVDDAWQEIRVPKDSLAFTWCQMPVVMHLDDTDPSLTIHWRDAAPQVLTDTILPVDASTELFSRSGRIRQLDLVFHPYQLFSGTTVDS